MEPVAGVDPALADRRLERDGAQDAADAGLLVRCAPRAGVADSLMIGPTGGVLEFGGHQLIVPPGALPRPTMISARVEAGVPTLLVHFEPSGLVFRRPAALVLDVDGCSIPAGATPDVVYLKGGTIMERIGGAFRSWKAVAAPIAHFSGYSIAL